MLPCDNLRRWPRTPPTAFVTVGGAALPARAYATSTVAITTAPCVGRCDCIAVAAAAARRPRFARTAPHARLQPPTGDRPDGTKPASPRFGGVFRPAAGGGEDGGDRDDDEAPVVSAAARDKPLWRRLVEDAEYDDLRTFVVAFAVALAFRALVIEPRYIPSQSMVPTFQVGDQLLVEKVSKYLRPFVPGDVVVFLPPNALVERGYAKNDAFIKRVVAAEGDTISISRGRVTLNGVVQPEPFIAAEPNYEWGPESVPPGFVMVLGDNRNNSYDSHMWGFLPTSNIIGRAIVRYWPPARIGSTVLERPSYNGVFEKSEAKPDQVTGDQAGVSVQPKAIR
jgi:signal peptidase I